MRIVITGSMGLVGSLLVERLLTTGHEVVSIDLRAGGCSHDENDIRAAAKWGRSPKHIDGIVHLAAVSRVAWGESYPELCDSINIDGTKHLVDWALMHQRCSWILFASSREVYGNPTASLVREDDPLAPVNHYGRSKLAGELIIDQARNRGLATAILRLSNVYGGRCDHPDRAVPSLVAKALADALLPITGSSHYFDFVHVEDVVDGLITAAEALQSGERSLPTVHLATGKPTTLGELAHLTVDICNSLSTVVEQDPRAFDVRGFCGDPDRARQVYGWESSITVRDGIARVASDIRDKGPLAFVAPPA